MYYYLFFLVISLFGLTFYDMYHGQRILFAKSTWWGLVISIALLLIFDLIGIHLNIFHTNQTFVSGLFIGSPDVPIEELLLLLLISYVSLLLHTLFRKNI